MKQMERLRSVKECKCLVHNSLTPYPTCMMCSQVGYLLPYAVGSGTGWDRYKKYIIFTKFLVCFICLLGNVRDKKELRSLIDLHVFLHF